MARPSSWKPPGAWAHRPDWHLRRLDYATATAVKAMIVFYGRGTLDGITLTPPSEPGQGWTVVVPVVLPGGDVELLLPLTTRGDAAPFIRGVPTLTRKHAMTLGRAAMADAWGALERSTNPVRPVGRKAGR